MKPITTYYKGYRFRSRLEARWAVFFDELSIDWDYEVEGYVLNDGTCYLPDFLLPTFNGGMYVEVKPTMFTDDEKQKCRDLCNESGKDVWLAEGVPDVRAYVYMSKNKLVEDNVFFSCGIPNHDKAKFENRMFADPDYAGWETYFIPKQYLQYGDIEYAANCARQARFEFK